MLSRPSDNGHTPFGDIFYSESPDLVHWGRHRHVHGAASRWTWQSTKIGAGPTPIETDEGWLVLYHGVLTSCNGFVYSMGAALLDLDEPWKVVARGRDYLLSPQVLYEQVGDVPNVVFPCAALVDRAADRISIYYGAADTVVCLAHAHLSEILEFVRGEHGDRDPSIRALVHERELRRQGARLRRGRRVGPVRRRDECGVRAARDLPGTLRRPPRVDHGHRLRHDRPVVRAPQLALGDARARRDRA